MLQPWHCGPFTLSEYYYLPPVRICSSISCRLQARNTKSGRITVTEMYFRVSQLALRTSALCTLRFAITLFLQFRVRTLRFALCHPPACTFALGTSRFAVSQLGVRHLQIGSWYFRTSQFGSFFHPALLGSSHPACASFLAPLARRTA